MGWFDDVGDTISDWFSSDNAPDTSSVAQYIPEAVSSVADYIPAAVAPAVEALPTDFVSNLLSQYNDTSSNTDSIEDLINNYNRTGSSEVPSWLSYTPATSLYADYETPTSVPVAEVAPSSSDPMNTAKWGTYFTPDTSTADNSSSIGDTLDKYATMLSSPTGKLLASLGGAGISAYGAMKQNALAKEAAAKQAQELAQRQAAAQAYNAPLRLALQRQAVEAPTARRGESVFFTNNKLPSYFAHGGEVKGALCQCGQQGKGLVRGGESGQSDTIDAKVSPGEYWMDADTVSALGDGNNEAGAKQLDRMREAIRAHKRSAPATSIPPKAKSPLAYMQKSKGAR